MLTILLRHGDGSEQIFTAGTVERLNTGEPCVPVGGPFLARGVSHSGGPGDDMNFELESPFGAVFVMNERGATVARYMATPQGVPSEVAAA